MLNMFLRRRHHPPQPCTRLRCVCCSARYLTGKRRVPRLFFLTFGVDMFLPRLCVLLFAGGQGQVSHRGHLLADRDRGSRDATPGQHNANQARLVLPSLLRDRGEA